MSHTFSSFVLQQLDGNIVRVRHTSGCEVSEADIRALMEVLAAYKPPVRLLIDYGATFSFSLRAQALLRQDVLTYVAAVAHVTARPTQPSVARFSMRVMGRGIPSRVFTDEEEARAWLGSVRVPKFRAA